MKNLFVLLSVLLGSCFFAAGLSTANHRLLPHKRPHSGTPIGTISLLIDKSNYELSLYDDKGWYATYPVVFGNNSLDDKKMEGDKNTPEGVFRIISKRIHEKWYRFLSLDYPTRESWEKFNKRKEKGEIPTTARIGGGIGIHGTWPHEDFVIDRYKNWTLGCISMKRDDVDEIFSFSPVGTKVTIRK